MATSPVSVGADSLASLESRVVKAVELVGELREEREIIMRDLEAALAAKDAAHNEITEYQAQVARLNEELESLRNDQNSVRDRIQKVLGQLDQLSLG